MVINANNHVVGYSTVNKVDSRVHAFWFDGNAMKDLGTLAPKSSNPLEDQSVALGINSDRKARSSWFNRRGGSRGKPGPDLARRPRHNLERTLRADQRDVAQRIPQEQKRVAELEDTVARLAGTVKEQAAQIQKVSAQVEVNKPTPRVVVNKP